MNTGFQASALFAAAVIVFAMVENVAARGCSVMAGCAGMTLTQNAAPDDRAPDSNSGTPPSSANPDQGSGDDRAQSPGDNDNGDDDGNNSDQISPPDNAQPPGCIFHDRPLELIV
jgi:hypothetical protein